MNAIATAPDARVCKCCGRQMPSRRGRAPHYCWAKQCQRARYEARRAYSRSHPGKPRRERAVPQEELQQAYQSGFENGMRPETTGPEANPFAWGSHTPHKELAAEWARGWTDGAEAFCIARDKAQPALRPS